MTAATLTTDELLNRAHTRHMLEAVGEVAPLFGIARTTAYRLIRAGTFPVAVTAVGSRYRCRSVDVLSALGIEKVAS